MADEVVKTIRIETSGAEQTVKGLKDEINSLRDALLNAEKGSDEYRDILEQLIKDQERLTDAMNAGKNGMKAAEGSYNSLVNKMAALKKVWRETADETERKNLGKQIYGIQENLKKLDASIGDYRRNVGNYTNSITEAFGAMGGAAKGMIGPLNGINKAFNVLKAHPIIGVISLLASLLINGIAKGFKSSEEATNKLRVAFSAFQAIGDTVTKMFQGLAKIIGDVAIGVVNFADKLGLIGPKMKARQEMTKKQIELEKKERDSITKTAQIEQEAADLREKASDEENYSISQRIEFLKQAQAKEEEGLQLEKEILEQKVNQLEAQLALTDSTGEELTKLNELKAKLVKVNSDISKSQTSANKEINALRKRGVQEAAQAQQQLLSLEKELLQQEYDLAVDGSEKQLKLAREIAAKDREIAISNAKAKIKDKETLNKQLLLIDEKYQRDLDNIAIAQINNLVSREKRLSELRASEYIKGSSSYLATVKQSLQKEVVLYNSLIESNGLFTEDVYLALAQFSKESADEFMKNYSGISTTMVDEFKFMKAETVSTINDIEDQLIDAEVRETELFNQIILEGTLPMSKYYKTQEELLRKFLEGEDKLMKKHGETQEEYTARLNAVRKEMIDATYNKYKELDREAKFAQDYRTLNDRYKKIYSGDGKNKYWLSTLYENEIKNLEIRRNQLRDELAHSNLVMFEYVRDNGEMLAENLSETALKMLTIKDSDKGREYIERFESVFGIDLLKENSETIKGDIEGALKDILSTGLTDDLFNDLLIEGLFPKNIADDYLAELSEAVDVEAQLFEKRASNWTALAQEITDVMSSIGEIYSIVLENEKRALEKEGKYTDAERKLLEKKYKVVQAIQIAEATINTISGALGAFMGITKDSGGWAIAFAAAQAAAVTAAGVAQIMKIKQTNPYSDNSNSLGNDATAAMSATVIPQVSDYTPDYGVNLTNRQDTEYLQEAIGRQRLFVSVVDINSVNNTVKATEREASF